MIDRQDINQTSITQGLTENEVIARRTAGLGNQVKLHTSRSYSQILKENLFTFINAVFLTISVVLIFLSRYGDAFLVIVVILGGVVVSVCQEIWAKQKLDQIALLTRPLATVIRESKQQNIDPSEIVVGDILVAQAGDQIVVDGQVVGEGRIEVDESLLTGESDLIPKQVGQPVYSGSFCVSGTACYEAQKVGTESLAYQLTVSARAFRQIYTPLQQEINLVIRVFLLLSCFLWILVAINWFIRIYTFADSVQYAAVIAGLVPSGLYLAITLAYALGAVKMVGQEVLIQQANAVESLSNVDVLCLDKTGTLTANRIRLQTVYPIGINEVKLRNLLGDYAASTTAKNQTIEAVEYVCSGHRLELIAEIPFTSARKWSGMSFAGQQESSDSGTYILGAPEVLATVTPLSTEVTQQIQELAQQGLRVLLFTHSPNINSLNNDLEQPQLPTELTPLGIISFKDELRPEARETIHGFSEAGIEVKVISGDNPQTVATLALQAGLGSDIQVISGAELAELDEAQFIQAAEANTIFGRVTPEQKAQLIRSFKEQGHYVAMIGDGVNDVLSLKEANLAIAMEGGSKATRSVADIVLLKNSFGSLPHTFLEGQRIRNGIQDVLKLFMIRVFCVTLLIFATGFVGGTFPLLNKHSAVVTLISVGFPSFCIPLWAKSGMLPRRSLVRSLLHFTLPATLSLTLVALGVYLGYLVVTVLGSLEENSLMDNSVVITNQLLSVPRSALVTIMILCGLLLVPFLKPPSRVWVGGEPLSRDWRYSLVALALLGIYVVILAVPPLRQFFELSLLSAHDYVVISWVAIVWCLLLRYVWRAKLLDKFLGVDLG
ncbi:MAG: HAD-IC family P-type ATPase [Okeania sp. SIO2C2]|uniref:HAD-IC family P-type ATPase n=1 Tax=Okeania sp. SIO2C2 TaxID=2607787 RepID=UPI0013BD05F6|nr:HAD-IC family P-type ATPase [Okeania sp. SIO2C2]NEP85585.1 HAD-IC family P-type ATPase [Okeania sp. SIO2C2]